MKLPVAAVTSLSVSFSAAAQVEILSATRAVFASAETVGSPPDQQSFSTTAVDGWWDQTASVWLGSAHQRSLLGPSAIEYHGEVSSGGGAGHHGEGRSTLTAVFDAAEGVRWDLTNAWARYPLIEVHLTRLSDGEDLFAGVDWVANPGHAEGVLAAGRYELRLTDDLIDAGFDAGHDVLLNFTVPAPATVALPALAVLLARRRRS